MNLLRRLLDRLIARPRPCPHCGAPEAGYLGASRDLDELIRPGMYVVCLDCAGLVLIGPKLEFLPPTRADLERLERSPRAAIVRREQAMVRDMRLTARYMGMAARPRPRRGGGPW